MFAFDRSAIAVLAPLALLVGVVLWSNLQDREAVGYAASQQAQARENGQELDQERNQAIAANLPSR